MLKKLDNSKRLGNSHISILYPGLDFSGNDTGYFSIGRIDQAQMGAGTVIKMHPHINDDILSYFRTGKVKHLDSEGFSEYITPERLMLMKAGRLFHHEEAALEDLEGLQIFIRPSKKDSDPEVIFQELDTVDSVNRWRLIASPDADATKLQLSSETWIYDMQVSAGETFGLPKSFEPEFSCFLYVFQGEIIVNGEIELKKKDCLFIQNEPVRFITNNNASVVLFVTDTKAPYYDQGMYSGNKISKL